jgi:hypothetical protein
MVSIAVGLSRGERVATVSPALAPPEDTKSDFAHSLLANGVENAPKPETADAHANKNAVATEAEARKKNATAGLDLATGSTNYEEIESRLDEANGNSKPVEMRSTAMAKDQRAAKDEPVSNAAEVKDVEISEVKRPDLFEASKVSVSERTKLKVPETKDPKVGATKLERAKPKGVDGSVAASGPVADETRMGDTVTVQSVTLGNGTSVPLNSLKDSDIPPTIPSGRSAGDKHSESAMTASPIAQRETKETQNNANHLATLSESSSNSVSTVTTNVEQAKNGAVAVSADLTGSGAAGTGKTEVGIGSVITVVQHVGTDLPGQAGSAAFRSDGSTASFGAVVHQGSAADVTPSVNSHNTAYGGEQMTAGESRPGLLAATPTSLEVGVANGTHGWLKIRAEMEGGVVTASLSSGSMAGQEMLHRELPSLAAYLQEEKLGVNTLVLKPAEMPDPMGANSGGSLQRQGQPSQQQSDGARDGIGAGDKSGLGGLQQRPIYESWNSFDGGFLPAMAGNVGSWLNVRV